MSEKLSRVERNRETYKENEIMNKDDSYRNPTDSVNREPETNSTLKLALWVGGYNLFNFTMAVLCINIDLRD